MGKLLKLRKKMATGGNPSMSTYDPNAGYSTANSLGTGTAGAINPIWGAVAGVGTAGSKAVIGNGSDETKNQAGDLLNPFNQFSNNENAGDWALSFLNPFGSSLMKGKRNADKYREHQEAIRNANNQESIKLATLRGNQDTENPMYSLSQRKQGGRLSKLSNNTVLAKGPSHEQGGIDIPSMGVEIEGNETMKKLKDGGTYVFSDTLVNPNTGNTFAEDDTKLSKIKGRIEKNSDGRFRSAALKLIGNREQKLLDTHEETRSNMGLEIEGNAEVSKYPDGGRILLQKITNSENGNIKYIYDKDQVRPDEIPLVDTIEPTDNLSLVKKPLAASLSAIEKPHNWNTYTPPSRERDTVSFGTRGNKPNNDPRNKRKFDLGGGINEEDQRYFDNEYQFKYSEVNDPSITAQYRDNPDDTTLMTDSPSPSRGRVNFKNLNKLTPYIDNITGAIFNDQRSKENLPDMQTLDYLNPNHVNYSQALKDTRDIGRNFNKGIDQTNANASVANKLKAISLSEQMKNVSRVSQEESNINKNIDNEFAARNKGIEQTNKQILFNNQERKRIGRDEIRREYQQNIENANDKYQGQERDKEFKLYDQEQKDTDLKGKDPRVRKLLGKRNGGKLAKMYC